MLKSCRRQVSVFMLLALALVLLPAVASASHSWSTYHWARQSNPFTVKLIDRVTATWDPILATSSSDWTASSVLNTTIIAGTGSASSCTAVNGQVKVCNASYGSTGWLGIASISVSGSHITQGTVKLNDTYHNSAPYNTTAWRNLVSCQEVGHTLGLDHQDENNTNPNLGTCMDYTNSPGTNQHPNTHDYNQLVTIYSHLDSTTTTTFRHAGDIEEADGPAPPAMRDLDLAGPGQWGRLVGFTDKGMTAVYELDFGHGHKIFTFVIYADPKLLRAAGAQ
ncbi:MAG: hypothetical protein ABJC13_21085 [Acidobacteriota bacterium]